MNGISARLGSTLAPSRMWRSSAPFHDFLTVYTLRPRSTSYRRRSGHSEAQNPVNNEAGRSDESRRHSRTPGSHPEAWPRAPPILLVCHGPALDRSRDSPVDPPRQRRPPAHHSLRRALRLGDGMIVQRHRHSSVGCSSSALMRSVLARQSTYVAHVACLLVFMDCRACM